MNSKKRKKEKYPENYARTKVQSTPYIYFLDTFGVFLWLSTNYVVRSLCFNCVYRLQFQDSFPKDCPLKKANCYLKRVSNWQLKHAISSGIARKEFPGMGITGHWLQPPLEATELILLMALNIGTLRFAIISPEFVVLKLVDS